MILSMYSFVQRVNNYYRKYSVKVNHIVLNLEKNVMQLFF